MPAARSGPISGPLPKVVIDDDDPLTSPSFPRIETDDSRSYRRSRSASSTSPGISARPGDPYSRSQPADSDRFPVVPQGQPDRPADDSSRKVRYARPAASAGQLSGEHSLPAADPYGAPAPTGRYQVSASPVPASPVPASPVPASPDSYHASPAYPADADYQAQGGTGSYLMPPVQPVAVYHGDPYSLPGTSLPAGPGGGYPAESAAAHYQPGGSATGSYPVPSAAPPAGELGLGPADQPVKHQYGYGRDSGQQMRPETSYGHSDEYSAAGYGGDSQPGFGVPEPGGHPSGPFPVYQGSAPFGTGLPSGQYQAVPPAGQYQAQPSGQYQAVPSGQYQAVPSGQYEAVPPAGQYQAQPSGQYQAVPSGQYQAVPPGQYQAVPPAGQPTAPYQAYEPPGYPEPDSYASADPYAVDPYGYSGYSNGY